MKDKTATAVIGVGLARSEVARQLVEWEIRVHVYEMPPRKIKVAHRTSHCAELVCSNSFKSRKQENAHGLIKEELRLQNSLILEAAKRHAMPAGQALAVGR